MKISFVIPAYNEEKYLPLCLQAIFLQQKTASCDVEVIVVNNASTDATHAIAASFPSVIVIDESRKGITFARQAGLAAATGDLIANVDADSILTPGWLEAVAKNFSRNEKLVALSGPFLYYDLPVFSNLQIHFYYLLGYITYLINRFVLRVGSLLQGGNFVVRRSALQQIGGFNTAIAFYGEDTEIAKRLSQVGPVVFTFSLPMYSSARRIKHEGLLTMAVKYPMNFFWTTFFKRPFTTEYIDVRKQPISAFQTTVKNFYTVLHTVQITVLAVVLFLFGGAGYLYHEVTLFSHIPVAEAQQLPTPRLVKVFGPMVLKMQQKIHDWDIDADDQP